MKVIGISVPVSKVNRVNIAGSLFVNFVIALWNNQVGYVRCHIVECDHCEGVCGDAKTFGSIKVNSLVCRVSLFAVMLFLLHKGLPIPFYNLKHPFAKTVGLDTCSMHRRAIVTLESHRLL